MYQRIQQHKKKPNKQRIYKSYKKNSLTCLMYEFFNKNCLNLAIAYMLISPQVSFQKPPPLRKRRGVCVCEWLSEWLFLSLWCMSDGLGSCGLYGHYRLRRSRFYYNKCCGHSSLGKEKKKHLCQQPQLISIPPQFAERYTYFKANLPKIVSCCLMSAMHAWMAPPPSILLL